MTTLRRTLLTLSILLISAPALAQDEEGFSGRVALGYLATSGNSESENFSTNFELGWNYAPWRHTLDGSAVRASANDVDTAEAYTLGWQSNYDFNERAYAFGLIAWINDEFSGYEQQVRQAVGYGRRFIDTERHTLNGEIGGGARQADLRDGTSQDEAIVRLNADYTWTISETSTFGQSLAIETGSDNTFTQAVTSLTADVFGGVALVVSYTIRNNSDVPVGLEKRDTFTAVSLEYSF
ncbi:MAG: DUF481 domain-containing protein [Gammaproteobacteria bacterium]